jgi:enamine deaminase RidA (YjgF/YER057c/UK114 family)
MLKTSSTTVGRRFLTVAAAPQDTLATFVARFADEVEASGGHVIRVLACGPAAQREAALAALSARLGTLDWPVTWLHNERLRGFQADIVDTPPQRLTWAGRPCGARWEDEAGEWLVFGGIRADRPDLSLQDRYEATFEEAERALQAHGFVFEDVARTWLYVHHILDSYDDLNRARHAFFHKRGLFDRLVPASTGIGASDAEGAALVMEVLALKPRRGAMAPVASPLQGPALAYGSAFSRAVVLPVSGRVMVSGTASIDASGRTVHDTPRGQVDMTMLVVEGILHSACREWRDVDRAIIYVKDAAAEAAAQAWFAERDLELPAIWVESDVCRTDLLYEIEVDAALPADQGPTTP